MDEVNIEKKLREAQFFLDKMRDQEKVAFDDKEHFDFYLSAFLSAAWSVKDRLLAEQKERFDAWQDRWRGGLKPKERKLYKFLVQDRSNEVHGTGSRRRKGKKTIPVVGGSYKDSSGELQVSSPPGTPDASVVRPSYSFTIDGVERTAIDACMEYLSLARRMVAQFKADNP